MTDRLQDLASRTGVAWHAIDPPEPVEAADLLLKGSAQTIAPVDLSLVIALWPGLRVELDDLDGAGYILDLGSQGAEILLRKSDTFERRRFTLAHELGHWVRGMTCADQMDDRFRTVGPGLGVERWCDLFAEQLLMPRWWITSDVEALIDKSGLGGLSELPARYGVSPQAAWIRVAELTSISVVRRAPGSTGKIQEFASGAMSARQRSALVRTVKSVSAPADKYELEFEGMMVAVRRASPGGGVIAYALPSPDASHKRVKRTQTA